MLDKQIQIYAVDTGNFYSNSESYLHKLNHKVRMERNLLKKEISFWNNYLTEYGFSKKDITNMQNGIFDEIGYIEGSILEFQDIIDYYHLYQIYLYKGKKAKETKSRMLQLLKNKVEANIISDGKHHVRELRFLNANNQPLESLDENIISIFDSSFTRMIGAEPDTLSEDFMVIQVYYFSIIQDLIYHGFMYKGEKYIYFTSSAGQIRTKKCVFIKESVYKQHEKTMMCGLTIDTINAKGGNNPNKHLAYLALNNSATDVWEEFDIDKAIVIDDFETEVFGTYDLVDDVKYTIKRISDYIPITHTDGAGMMLPCMGRNRMVRLPWIKGLLGAFDFVKFITEYNYSPIIKDIYGKEHDVIAEEIQIIFTKSQFKMWKYYDSWEQYKEYYKKYGCTAGYTNMEEERIPNTTINYQMLQSLTDITDEEVMKIAGLSVDRLNNLCSSIDDVKRAFGATPYNQNKTALQKAIILYPNLLNDVYIRNKLKDIKDSMVKSYKAGKLQVKGKYTFLLPDFYAACEYWFGGIKNPDGLLVDGEVFCWLFRKDSELDCLRSPHLYREHAIRTNIACNDYKERQVKLREWFTTDAIYTSCHDLISKILMFDVDGDKSLVIADKNIVSIAKRNMIGIVPLYYNMKKALPSVLNNRTIYEGLSEAFTGSNIGQYSNSISKIWNNDVFVSGTDEEKQEALDIIKILCMENNFKIDYAKTLYMPERPKDIKKKIVDYTKGEVPHFFVYAKDKENWQVEDITQSLVNKLDGLVPNPRINLKCIRDGKSHRLAKPDYTLMMTNPDIEVKVVKSKSGRLLDGTNFVVMKYDELAKNYYQKINAIIEYDYPRDAMSKTQVRKQLMYQKIVEETKQELAAFGYQESEIVDILVKYLYGIKNSEYKDLLWTCYGELIYKNLQKNVKPSTKEIQCIDCGEWLEVKIKDTETCRCLNCSIEHKKIVKREQNKRAYEKRKKSVGRK